MVCITATWCSGEQLVIYLILNHPLMYSTLSWQFMQRDLVYF